MVWLVIGLGNPGPEYTATRHNVGQMVVDELAKRYKVKWSAHKSRTEIAAFKIGVGDNAHSVIIAKSKSYMNETGGPAKRRTNPTNRDRGFLFPYCLKLSIFTFHIVCLRDSFV